MLHEKPAPRAKLTSSMSLIKYGTGLNGIPGICHGGALLMLMDEAMLHILVANTVLENDFGSMKAGENYGRLQLYNGKSAQEMLKGRLATATMDVNLLAPVLCPSVFGIETDILEDKGTKMSMESTMRDRQGELLLKVGGLWVKIRGAAKL